MKEIITEFCIKIAENPLLVQGAGGNISWKDNNILWVKASGTQISDARIKDIFVAVDFLHLQSELQKGNFAAVPQLITKSALRPSIETLLHAVMPHKIVVHLHAVEILAYLVHETAQQEIESIIKNSMNYAFVDYFKPGEELAKAISDSLKKSPKSDIILLQNHGIVIGGDNIAEIETRLSTVSSIFNADNMPVYYGEITVPPLAGYIEFPDPVVQNLVLNDKLFSHVKSDWALYPDHVVFLGDKAICYNDLKEVTGNHELIFVKNCGVFCRSDFSIAKQAQLRCFYEILIRQPENPRLRTLSKSEIGELLNWDAEHYRMQLNMKDTD